MEVAAVDKGGKGNKEDDIYGGSTDEESDTEGVCVCVCVCVCMCVCV